MYKLKFASFQTTWQRAGIIAAATFAIGGWIAVNRVADAKKRAQQADIQKRYIRTREVQVENTRAGIRDIRRRIGELRARFDRCELYSRSELHFSRARISQHPSWTSYTGARAIQACEGLDTELERIKKAIEEIPLEASYPCLPETLLPGDWNTTPYKLRLRK